MSLMSLRFLPGLDLNNAAPNCLFWVPLVVTHQDGSKGLRDLSVEVSYDDGKSWRKVPALPTGQDRWLLPLSRPSGGSNSKAPHVSLRASATDRSGNTAEYSVLRAYH